MKYTIVAGVNGVGKSSFMGRLSAQSYSEFGVIINADELALKYGGIVGGARAALDIIDECIEKRLDFTQETTLSGKRTLRTVRKVKDLGYDIDMFYIGLSSEKESIIRIENRVRKGGHDIPDEDVIRRFRKRFDDLLAILPFCSNVYFIDNENGFREAGNYRGGRMNIYENAPQWLRDFKEYTEK